MASIVATSANFILHNLWTFSDRQHQGLRFARGLFSFSLISAMGLFATTALYVGFTRAIQHFAIVTSRLGVLGIPLACQLAAILVGACASYLLNGEFTWPEVAIGTLGADRT
jgi:putative flippase GtrA